MNDYRQAANTFAFLRIEHDTADPQEVTAVLGIAPTQVSMLGYMTLASALPWNVWVLSSYGSVSSGDTSDHIEWLVESIGPRSSQLRVLQERGHRIRVHCLWIGKGGYGGPRVSAKAMRGLADLGLEAWIDVGFMPEKEDRWRGVAGSDR